jgi:hypothetical protein
VRLKGPDLKTPDLKAPAFVADVYYDLRDRRLLPVIALIVVAIGAVPFLLGDEASEEGALPAVATESVAAPAEGGEAGASSLTVVQAQPGLRDYRKRLRRRSPTDPFVQRFSGPVLKGAKLNSSSETGSSSSSSTSTTGSEAGTKTSVTTTVEEPASQGGAPAKGGSEGGKPGLTLFTFAIDVQISRTETTTSGRQKKSAPKTRHGVLPATPLPGEKAPVVTYMGMNVKTKRAMLMVSPHVSSIFGDTRCVAGTDSCQLLEAEPGFPITFVYGPNEVRYKITVIKIEPVVRGKY